MSPVLRFTDAPIERTTAITDLIVAMIASGSSLYLARLAGRQTWKAGLWSTVFGLTGFAAALGAVSHGLALSRTVNDLLWHPLYLALGLTVALFGVGLIHDLWGPARARRWLPVLITLGVAFYLQRWLLSSSFLAFIVYEGVVMLVALIAYGVLAMRGRLPGAGLVAAGILVTIAAAIMQSTKPAPIRIVWPFDHNGLFHLVQMPGLVLLAAGIGRSLGSDGS